jgi:uncharacterized protein with PIN domain
MSAYPMGNENARPSVKRGDSDIKPMVSQETPDSQSVVPPPRLLVDAMLGKLARWLRHAGYDAEFWREGSDEELIAAARAQGRIVLTKDRALARRRGVSAVLVHAYAVDDQVAEARRALAMLGAAPQPYTRCAECNGALGELPHAQAEGLVPPYVWHTQVRFHRCMRCGRVYWKGTHWPAVQRRLASNAPEDAPSGPLVSDSSNVETANGEGEGA